jgi:hypothetical protein
MHKNSIVEESENDVLFRMPAPAKTIPGRESRRGDFPSSFLSQKLNIPENL